MDHIGLRFREIVLQAKTGRLSFQRGGIAKSFLVQDGGLLSATTNVSEERLGEILFRTGKISAEVQAALPKYSVPNHFIGESLVERRLISQRDLYEALLAQYNIIALTCFSFFDAALAFEESGRFFEAGFEQRISLPLIIERGIRNMEFHPALKTLLAGKGKIPFPKGDSPPAFLNDEEKTLWHRTAAGLETESLLAASGLPPEKFWKTVFLLYGLDLVDFREAGTAGTSPGASSRPREAPAPPEPAAVEEKPSPPPELREQIAEALELHRRLAEMDYYQLLGVSRTADDAEVKKGYLRLARRIHPDLFGRHLEAEDKTKIDELFDHLTKAYRTLSSKEDRAAYSQKGPAPARPDEEKDRGKQADVRFRQGKTLYNAGRFEEAVVHLEEAIRLKDEKGDYYLLLAMAESKIPAMAKKAERDFLKAVELEAWNPEPHVGLGVLYKKVGLTARARKEFERALELEADHRLAKRELEEMDGGPKKGLKGLFSKDFFGGKKK
ncbi:MAG: hypothetical protein FJY82_10295 [Candidatus Aminicenantes bacterium]|nr:hypothetical protein [Candidatus Aminicenantes bacterium]